MGRNEPLEPGCPLKSLLVAVVLFACVLVAPGAAYAVEIGSVQVLALTRDLAILSVAGERRVLRTGEISPEGVHLLQSTSAYAVIEVNGHRERMEPGAVTAPVDVAGERGAGGSDGVVLWSDPQGFFHADGEINGRAIRFLVDTGANTIALSSKTAHDVGLDLATGERGRARTASGVVDITSLTLDQVSVGSITLHNVSAGVIEGDYPAIPLLGASFLNHVEMQRAGIRMELRKR